MKKIVVHPGELLRESLGSRGLSQSEMARHLRLDMGSFNRLINGQRGFSPLMCIRLSRSLGLPDEHWAILQFKYNLDLINPKHYEWVSPLPKRGRVVW